MTLACCIGEEFKVFLVDHYNGNEVYLGMPGVYTENNSPVGKTRVLKSHP